MVHNSLTRFVRTDRELLRQRFEVREWYQRGRGVNLAKLARAVRGCDIVVGWFASWHTFMPVLLARRYGHPALLVVGGYDSANMNAIGYGNMRGGVKRWVSRWTMQQATALVTNSDFTRREVICEAGIPPARVHRVYHGFAVPPLERAVKQALALTIGNVDRANLRRKGIEPFVQAAACLPDTRFVVVGRAQDDSIHALKRIAPPNVTFAGWVEEPQLEDYLARARVYVQPSLHEGFGMAVAEAMLYECVPVVTRAGALPEVVGKAGLYVDSTEPAALGEQIRRGLELGREWGARARARITSEFPLERRRGELEAVIERCMQG